MEDMISVLKLSKDLKKAASTLGHEEARFLVQLYYKWQEDRMRSNSQERELDKRNAPHEVISWFKEQAETLEKEVKKALDVYSKSHEISIWMRSIDGIGPVLAAGYLANLSGVDHKTGKKDIWRFNHVGHLWSYCGVAPGQKRTRGEKIDFDPAMKRLAWITGEQFKRLPKDKGSFYRGHYETRKAYEIKRNEEGIYADQAEMALKTKKISKNTGAYDWYSRGKLPPGHIDARACRWTAKLFLSHLHEKWWKMGTGENYNLPYALSMLNHADYISPPE